MIIKIILLIVFFAIMIGVGFYSRKKATKERRESPENCVELKLQSLALRGTLRVTRGNGEESL